MEVRIEVEQDSVVIVFPRQMDHVVLPWKHAQEWGDTLERAAADCPLQLFNADGELVWNETSQFRLAKYLERNVVLFFPWGDRVRLSADSARIVARAIKMYAQDCEYAQHKGVRFVYKNGHASPMWLTPKKTVFGPKKT